MEIMDKNMKVKVDVYNKDCLTLKCYWPRRNPGSFSQGRGYRSYGDKRDDQWLYGTRNAHGCPDITEKKEL